MSALFDYIQTFYINPETVNSASEVMLTSVELFFKSKPNVASIAGGVKPNITVFICDVVNNLPDPSLVIKNSVKILTYDEVNTSADAKTATVCGFNTNVILKSGKFYGIVLKFDSSASSAYVPWVNKQGDRLVGTNIASPGSQNRFDGSLYKGSTSDATIVQPISNQDIKFKVKIAKYTNSDTTIKLVNRNYEFLSINTYSGVFSGGELVYKNSPNTTGTVTVSSTSLDVTGSSTTFTNHTSGQYIIVSSGGTTNALKITNIANDTLLTVESLPTISATSIGYKVPPTAVVSPYINYVAKQIYLVDSSAANGTFCFEVANSTNDTANGKVIGVKSGAAFTVKSIDRFSIDSYVPNLLLGNPSTGNFSIAASFANSSNNLASSTNIDLLKFNYNSESRFVLSRSTEVVSTSLYTSDYVSKKSGLINVSFTVTANAQTTSVFSVPYLNSAEADVFIYQNDISNTTSHLTTLTNTLQTTNYDTEVGIGGSAKVKWISKKVNFAQGRQADDLVAYVYAYRPANTKILVYAKIHNTGADSEAFEDKAWTPLEIKDNAELYSSNDPLDIVEYTYGLPQTPALFTNSTSQGRLSGTFTIQQGNTVIGTSVDQSAIVTAGDLIKITDSYIPNNHEVFLVASSNATTVTIDRRPDFYNTNLTGALASGIVVDKLKYNTIAWNNIAHDNTATYVTTGKNVIEKFDTMQIKVVLLADNAYSVPKVEQMQVIGVSV